MAFATDAFLARFLPSGRDACTLVVVFMESLNEYLYLSTREVVTPGSPPIVWQAALSDIGSVVEPGDLGAYDPGLATFDFRLTSRTLSIQNAGESALSLLAEQYWYGAPVTAYYWETGLTDFADALQIFTGIVIDYEVEDNEARITCQQRGGWIKRVPVDVVTRARFPRAPEKSIGMPAGAICYGDLRPPPARDPATEYGLFQQGITSVAGMRRAGVRGSVVSIGTGAGNKGRVLFASHPCHTFNSDVDGSTPAIELQSRICEIDPKSGDDFNDSTGTGFEFDDITSAHVQPFDVFFPVLVIDSEQPSSNAAENGRAATDAFNDTSYMVLDYNAGKRDMYFALPDVSPVGKMIDIKLVAGWTASGGAGTVPPDAVVEFVGVGGSTVVFAITNSSTPTSAGASVDSLYWPTDGWSFGGQGCYIRAYYSGTATGHKAHLHYIGLVIKLRPDWPVVTESRIERQVSQIKHHTWSKNERESWRAPGRPLVREVTIPETNQVSATFYASLLGYADDGSGTYTGTADALIERPPDVLRHFLATYCDEASFETSGEAGDLEDLRDDLVTWRNSDMKSALAIDEFLVSSDVVRTLARASLCWFFLSCFTDKWSGVAWKPGRAVEFPRRLTRYDLCGESAMGGPRLSLHRDEVQNDIRIRYGHDAYTRQPIHEVSVGPDHSSSGHKWRQIRDETLKVVASESDRLDFSIAGVPYSVNLTPGEYTGSTLRSHTQTQMNGAAAFSTPIHVAYGMLIVAGENDQIPINDGANKAATIAAGDYNEDPDALATAAQTALNAVSSNWTVTYSASTRKFTIDRTAGTKQVNWQTGTNAATCAATAMGFDRKDLATAGTSDFGLEPYRFAFSIINTGAAFSLDFETGSNGIDAATPRAAGELLGFDMARDWAPGTSYVLAHSPKSNRERLCEVSASRYGRRPELTADLRGTNDTDTAREVRNRIFALWGKPPVEIQFETERMPDLQKGMTFDFDASLDELKPYTVPGTDGSWAGKVFVAVRVERHSLPTSHQSVVAFEVPAE